MQTEKELLQKGIGHVVVSMGKKGLISITKENVLWAKVPLVKTVNTVGCGDGVVAAYAMSLLKQEDGVTALKYAAAISAANAATLENGDISQQLVEELVEKVQVERR